MTIVIIKEEELHRFPVKIYQVVIVDGRKFRIHKNMSCSSSPNLPFKSEKLIKIQKVQNPSKYVKFVKS